MSNPTCALVLIGNELLSGRTEDANMNHIARRMSDIGIRFLECRVIPDDKAVIISCLKELIVVIPENLFWFSNNFKFLVYSLI